MRTVVNKNNEVRVCENDYCPNEFKPDSKICMDCKRNVSNKEYLGSNSSNPMEILQNIFRKNNGGK